MSMLPKEFAKAVALDKSLEEAIMAEQESIQEEMQLPVLIRLGRQTLASAIEQYVKIRAKGGEATLVAAAVLNDALDTFVSLCQKVNAINVSKSLGLSDILTIMERTQAVLYRELATRLPDEDVNTVVETLKSEVRVPGTADEMEMVEPPSRIARFMDQSIPDAEIAEHN